MGRGRTFVTNPPSLSPCGGHGTIFSRILASRKGELWSTLPWALVGESRAWGITRSVDVLFAGDGEVVDPR